MAPRAIVAAVFFSGLVSVPCARASGPDVDRMVDIGSHRLQIHVEGTGTPPVVIDAGLADTLDKLKPLSERLAGLTTVITFNRAGYGKSEPGPLPRDAGREADELKALLDSASVQGPYVLVGHSLGALNVQVFASRYPEAVAGMVLLDPPPLSFLEGREYPELRVMAERMTAEWQAIADSAAASGDAQEKAKGAFFRMIASEHREMFGESVRLLNQGPRFKDMPLVVIASGRPNPAFGGEAEKFQKDWIEQSRALVGRSGRGRFVLAAEASHFLYLDAPDLVAESVSSVVHEAGGR